MADSVDPRLAAGGGLPVGFSPDALLEAARDRAGDTSDEFAARLTEALYSDIKAKFGGEWPEVARLLSLRVPGNTPALTVRWRWLIDRIRTAYPELTAMKVAEVVAALPVRSRPLAVVSFNAEPLLYALIHAVWATQVPAPAQPTLLDPQTSTLSSLQAGRVPYYYPHGRLSVPNSAARVDPALAHLVFSESAYLALANASYSWQANAFIAAAAASTMVFVGASLTDPNLRRWLGWQHRARLDDLDQIGRSPDAATRHFWIRRTPGSEIQERWVESLVADLGVRVVWLNHWDEAGTALRRMLNLDRRPRRARARGPRRA